MRIEYKNNRLERVITGVNVLTAGAVVATFILLFGFNQPLLPAWILHTLQVVLLCVFVIEKIKKHKKRFITKSYNHNLSK